MGLLTYPRSIWTPQPHWARQRNAAGQRIRVDGARMNDTECCCVEPDPCELCDGGVAPLTITATIHSMIDGTGAASCDAFKDCELIEGTYELDRYFFASVTDGCNALYHVILTPQLYCRESFGLRWWFLGVELSWNYVISTDQTTIRLRAITDFNFATPTPPAYSSTLEEDTWKIVESGRLPCSGDRTLPYSAIDSFSDRCQPDMSADISW